VSIISSQDSAFLNKLKPDNYRARIERGFLIHVEAFDWNCPQHITPRYTESQVSEMMAPILAENARLKLHDK
jgi:predicted pyridoxine 5'-phosphate oxidase superfamily flavin-nucleotide-binding protein